MPARSLFLFVTLAFLVAAALAQANRGTIKDSRGDAKAPWDITKLVVDNGDSKLRIQVHYRGRLRPKHGLGLLTNVGIDMGDPSDSIYTPDFTVDMLRGSPDPQVPNRFELVRHIDYDVNTVRCAGLQLRAQYGRGLLEFVIPQSCFGALAGRLRLTAYTYAPRGPVDEADYIRHWGPWLPQG